MDCNCHTICDFTDLNKANLVNKKDWFLSEYEEWRKRQQQSSQTETVKVQKSKTRFTVGDCMPKQGWNGYARYITPCVPPDEYLTDENNKSPTEYDKKLLETLMKSSQYKTTKLIY